MKRFLFFALIFYTAVTGTAAEENYTVGQIQATTVRMHPSVILRRFPLKPGDRFTLQDYERAQDKLHDMRVFKKLDFSTRPYSGGKTDIFIHAQDGSYIFPLAFVSGGKKSVAALSLAEGNLFKLGETGFLFAGGSRDGFSTRIGLHGGDNFLQAGFTNLNAQQRFYTRHWSNAFGVFSTTDDEEDYQSQLRGQVHVKKTEFSLIYAHKVSEIATLYARPEWAHYTYAAPGFDPGRHNNLTAGIRLADDIRKGANMGALSGYGLTDKAKSLQNLPRARSGYATDLYYTDGGSWTGSNYNLSKLGLQLNWALELKQRHMLVLGAKAQDAVKASFSDLIPSTDLLSGQGRYDRLILGKRGAGANATFIYYLLRNQTGLLSLTPFYETAWIYAAGGYRNHSGAGATLAYRFWRFPLPVGLNYTHNLTDGSSQVSFVVGGAF